MTYPDSLQPPQQRETRVELIGTDLRREGMTEDADGIGHDRAW